MARDFFENKEYNRVLLETENFIVIPSLGSLIEGWLLIVPKVFEINLSQLDDVKLIELENLIRQIEIEILPKFGPEYVLFEHGPASSFSKVGCGVDYAHLHFVPCKFDLLKGLTEFLDLDYDWRSFDNILELSHFKNSESDYLMLRDQTDHFFITFEDEIQSQTFRKVIAHYLGIPEKFDWKLDLNNENIDSTINKLKHTLV